MFSCEFLFSVCLVWVFSILLILAYLLVLILIFYAFCLFQLELYLRERNNIKLGELGGSLKGLGGGKRIWSKYSVREKLIKRKKKNTSE